MGKRTEKKHWAFFLIRSLLIHLIETQPSFSKCNKCSFFYHPQLNKNKSQFYFSHRIFESYFISFGIVGELFSLLCMKIFCGDAIASTMLCYTGCIFALIELRFYSVWFDFVSSFAQNNKHWKLSHISSSYEHRLNRLSATS